MRSTWKGNISFGLVSIPIQLFPTSKDRSIDFHIVDKAGTCRLRQKLYCPETGKEYDFGDTAKGYEIAPGKYVLVDKDELKNLKPESGHSIDIKDFIDLDEIDPIYFDKSYYVSPEESGVKAYALLHKSMLKAKKVAIAKFVMRQTEYLAVIRPMANMLSVATLHYHDEIIPAKGIPHAAAAARSKPGTRELSIADQLIENMTGPFKPEQYKDEYQKKVLSLVKNKSKGKKTIVEEPEDKAEDNVIDLMEALKKSLKPKTKTQARDKKRASGK